MLIVFRVDSAPRIGLGHLMRCLTLATALRDQDATCEFICRNHAHNSINLIKQEGFRVYELPKGIEPKAPDCLGVTPQIDATETCEIIKSFPTVPDWLIVDHYGIDRVWEHLLRPFVKRIFVIDDLANRFHDCDILLDQNDFSGLKSKYAELSKIDTKILIGSKYSIIRSEFIHANKIIRPINGNSVKSIFVYFGSTDPHGLTLRTIRTLCKDELNQLFIEVILSEMSDTFDQVVNLLKRRSRYRLHNFYSRISEIMNKVDMAIGAGGSTTKERIALGLPSVVISYGKDQHLSCIHYHKLGLINYLGKHKDVSNDSIFNTITYFKENSNYLRKISKNCLAANMSSGVDNLCHIVRNYQKGLKL